MISKTIKLMLSLILIMTISCKQNKTDISTNKIEEEGTNMEAKQIFKSEKTLESHLAKAQYYRWYQVYEVPFTKARIENQKDIIEKTHGIFFVPIASIYLYTEVFFHLNK